MKYLKKYHLFEEINKRDISFIEKNFDDYFTVSFEFEIETNDETNLTIDLLELDDSTLDDIIEDVISDYELKEDDEFSFVLYDIAYAFIDSYNDKKVTKEDFENYFNDVYKTYNNIDIIKHLKNSIKSVIFKENYIYLEKQIEKHLPNFYSKWKSKMDFVDDATLDRGIEIKPKTYTNSISESIELINDFYNDFDNQDYWKFSNNTGLHINVGTHKKSDWNPIKGLLILNDFSKTDDIPYTFKDMTWRLNNRYCGSLMPYLNQLKKKEKTLLKNINLHNLEESENILNNFLFKKIREIGFKNLGFNITKLDHNYCEFRYAGGIISKEVLIEKVKYFSFVVYTMTNKEYKRKEYLKKLYKFLDNL